MYVEYVFIVIGILMMIYALIEVFILFPKKAMYWWNNLSHYGKSVLMTKIGINNIADVTKSDICILYRNHIKNKL